MAHTFKIPIKNDLSETLKEVEDSIVKNGGKFKGDSSAGGFSGKTVLGKIEGEYTCVSDDEVEITITKKPFAAPQAKIESAIRKYFA